MRIPPTQPTATVTSETGLAASEQIRLPAIHSSGMLTHLFGVSDNIPSHLSVLSVPVHTVLVHAF